MSSAATIRVQIEKRLPGAFSTYAPPEHQMLRTGVPAIDSVAGGVPKSALTQVCGARWTSSGKTALLVSLLARSTRAGECCALIDSAESFDPISAEAAGVDLEYVLWVRCADNQPLSRLEQAFKAADILLRNGGFGLIGVDLGNCEERLVRRVPLSTWFRFARVVEKMPTALVLLTPIASAQSCAGLTVRLASATPAWSQPNNALTHGRLLDELEYEAEVARTRLKKPVASVGRGFGATARWME
jgi:hypothetical protein